MYAVKQLLCFVLATLLIGCGGQQGGMGLGLKPREPRHGFSMINRCGADLQAAEVEWGEFKEQFGNLVANGGKSIGTGYFGEPPAKVRVWYATVEEARFHVVEADVPQVTREKLNDGHVSVVLLPDRTVKVGIFSHKEYYEEDKESEFLRDGAPDYQVATKNKSGPIKDIRVFFGPYIVFNDHESSPDGVTKGWSFRGALPYPVSDDARVEWKTPDGVKHQKELELKPSLPPNLDGVCICFEIGDKDQVRLKAVPVRTKDQVRNQDFELWESLLKEEPGKDQ